MNQTEQIAMLREALKRSLPALQLVAEFYPSSGPDVEIEIKVVEKALVATAAQEVQEPASVISEAVPVDRRREFSTRIVNSVAEIPDRESPEDHPEMMLVTTEELFNIIASSFEIEDELYTAPPAQQPSADKLDALEKLCNSIELELGVVIYAGSKVIAGDKIPLFFIETLEDYQGEAWQLGGTLGEGRTIAEAIDAAIASVKEKE